MIEVAERAADRDRTPDAPAWPYLVSRVSDRLPVPALAVYVAIGAVTLLGLRLRPWVGGRLPVAVTATDDSSIAMRSADHPVATSTHPSWSHLGRRAKGWRIAHALWSFVQLACLARIWFAAIRGRRSPGVWASVALLGLEGAALVVGGGDCPLGPRQADWGDPVPFFELVLRPRAAKEAIPALAIVSAVGIGLLLVRRPGLVIRS